MVVEFTIWWILPLILIGFTIGLLVSIFGGGGGFFYVPLLTLVFQVPTQYAVATSLASIIPTTILGSLGHYRQGNLDVPLGLIFGVGGIVGAFFGAFASGMIPPPLMGKLFGIFMIVLSIPMLFSARRRAGAGTGESPAASRPLTTVRAVEGTVFGIVSGAMAGLFGVSGTPPVIAGLYLMGLPAVKVVGTSIFVLLFNAVAGLTGHLAIGQVHWGLTLFLAAGAATGAYLGPRYLSRIKTPGLERFYGRFFTVLVIALGIVMILE